MAILLKVYNFTNLLRCWIYKLILLLISRKLRPKMLWDVILKYQWQQVTIDPGNDSARWNKQTLIIQITTEKLQAKTKALIK